MSLQDYRLPDSDEEDEETAIQRLLQQVALLPTHHPCSAAASLLPQLSAFTPWPLAPHEWLFHTSNFSFLPQEIRKIQQEVKGEAEKLGHRERWEGNLGLQQEVVLLLPVHSSLRKLPWMRQVALTSLWNQLLDPRPNPAGQRLR